MTPRRRRRLGEIAAVVLLVTPLACRLDGDRKVAGRILDRYRRATGAKPLPASHVIRMRLSSETPGGGTGVAEVAWEPNRFRERIASAGATTERGIQGGKAYFVDEDGVTRVGSEPVLREMLARSYFWRRAWLFADQGGARLSLGPADPSSVSVRLQPFGSNPLLLSFSRRDGRLISVRSPRFDLDFAGERSFREAAGRRPPVRGEIAWAGLPTGSIEDATVGGGCGRFEPAAGLVDFERTPGGGIAFPARVNGAELRFALDADADGPPSISAERAASLSLRASRDVYGRLIASGATLEVGGFNCRGIHIEIGSAPEGADGVIGGTVFREAVVELDPKSGRLGLHDPAKWVSPAGFNRILVDDDGNRPVTTLRRGREVARLRAGSATGASDLRLAPASAVRLDVKTPGVVSELRWGALALPPLAASSETDGAASDWGDDGRLGLAFLLRFHAYVDMTHRWIYVRPNGR